MSIYKPSGICGDAATELGPELYRRWGHALGRQVEPAEKFVIGGDLRQSTPERLQALAEGLCQASVDCIDLGQLPTPMIFYAMRRLRAGGLAVVTGSHQAAAMNGLAWLIGDRPPGPVEVGKLEAAAQRAIPINGRVRTASRTLDISFDYVAWLQETWADALRSRLHVVIDPMHGCWSGRARRYLHAIFPECLVSVIRDQPDPAFGGHIPDCARDEQLQQLGEEVSRERAHLGIAFDGDGDRIALVDNQGISLSVEETTCVLLESLGRQLRGRQVIYDQRLSARLAEAARKRGAEPLIECGDPAMLRARMRQTGAVLGVQASGHYFFAALDGGDDPLFAACCVIAHLARSGKSLSKLRHRCPKLFMTPGIRLTLDAAQQERVLEQVREAWADYPQTTLDGLRIELPGGWASLRTSTTDAALTFRFEASDWSGLDDLVRRFCAALPELGDHLWNCYEVAMGVDQRTG